MRATLAVVLRASTMMRRKAHVSDRRTCRRPVRGDGRAGGTGDRAVKHPDDRATRIWCTGRDLHLFTKTGMVSTLAEHRPSHEQRELEKTSSGTPRCLRNRSTSRQPHMGCWTPEAESPLIGSDRPIWGASSTRAFCLCSPWRSHRRAHHGRKGARADGAARLLLFALACPLSGPRMYADAVATPPVFPVFWELPPSPVAVSPTVAPIVVVSGGAAFRPEQEDDRAQEYLDTKLTCPCDGWRARRSPNRRAPSGSGARWLRRVSPCVALGCPNGRENACQNARGGLPS